MDIRYTERELKAIANARQDNPTLPQRTLARMLYDHFGPGEIGYALASRSKASIYSALRRYDNNVRLSRQHQAA